MFFKCVERYRDYIVDIKRNGVHAQSAKIQALCTNTYRRRGRTIGNGRMIKKVKTNHGNGREKGENERTRYTF